MNIEKFNKLNEIKSMLETNGFYVKRIDDVKNTDNKFQFICEHTTLNLVERFGYFAKTILDIEDVFTDLTYSKYGVFIGIELKDKK